MIAALAFLTPLGPSRTPDDRTLGWFPVVGALQGLVLGGLWWVSGELWPPLVAAALVVAADAALTGMLHLDGLADSADGLLPHADRERRLEIMADPTVGAFGVAAVGVVLLLRVAAMATMAPAVLLVVALWSAARTAMAVTARAVPYARPTGLAAAFTGRSATGVTGLGLVVAGAAAVGAATVRGDVGPVVAVVVGALAAAGVVAVGRRRLGGFTGDVLGAAGVVLETVGLVVAAARW